MAFIAPVPVLARRGPAPTSSASHTTFLPALPSAATGPRRCPFPVASLPNDLLRAVTARFTSENTRSPAPREYRTMAVSSAPDFTGLSARVAHVSPVCRAGDHIQIALDVSRLALTHTHVSPGQFFQIRRPNAPPSRWRKRSSKPQRDTCFATISSPPGGIDGCFEILVNRRRDPLGLASMRVGDEVRISSVMGSGLDYRSVVDSEGDLFAFVDAPQGFAALKSLIEWGVFRSLSGEGANRTNHITIYYAVPSGHSFPYADRLSAWSVYGVNVIPLSGTSILEHLSSCGTLGRTGKPVVKSFVMACVSTNETFEPLFSSLILHGFRRSAIQKFTQEVMAREIAAFDESEEELEVPSEGEKPFGMPEDIYQQMKRNSVEKEVWQSWVHVRESMRTEFERKWAAQAGVDRENKRTETEKKQAWASWCAQNKEQWTQVKWDSSSWGQYWSSWKDANQAWTSKSQSWGPGSSSYSNHGGSTWNQQNSQEYWDWVGRGTGPRRSSSSPNSGSRGSAGQSYQERYGSSAGWGNANNRWSGYQKGGYKYQYEEPSNNKYGGQRQSNGYSTGGNTGGSGGWSGWNSNTSGRRASSGSRKNWNTSRHSTFGDLDFYGVLGIDSGANRADIKRAYRRKAMENHPDRNPDKSEEAHIKMKQIVVAWSVLKDDSKRKQYDNYGPGGL